MGTPAAIALLQSDGSVEAIYLSQDGQPGTAGRILLQAWNTRERVQQLLELGDLLRLGIEVGEAHDREDTALYREKIWCTAYIRDHGNQYERPSGNWACRSFSEGANSNLSPRRSGKLSQMKASFCHVGSPHEPFQEGTGLR